MNELDKTIRSLKRSLKELDPILIGNDYIDMARNLIKNEIIIFEEEYQKLHRIGAHDTFETIPVFNDDKIEIGYRIELWNKMTLESYHILNDNDILEVI